MVGFSTGRGSWLGLTMVFGFIITLIENENKINYIIM